MGKLLALPRPALVLPGLPAGHKQHIQRGHHPPIGRSLSTFAAPPSLPRRPGPPPPPRGAAWVLSVLPRCHPAAGIVTRSRASQVTRAAACHGHFLLRRRGAAPAPPPAPRRRRHHYATLASAAPRRLIYFNDPAFSCIAAPDTQYARQISNYSNYSLHRRQTKIRPASLSGAAARRRGPTTPKWRAGDGAHADGSFITLVTHVSRGLTPTKRVPLSH